MTGTPMTPFGKEHAERYDQTFAKLSSFSDALHLITWSVLCELGEKARVLCVGAGTGAELLVLAREFPGWRFTALDLSEHMLDVCRRRAEAAGVLSRCTFHVGPISSLPSGEEYDAATSILVSQFIRDAEERRDFFGGIHERLRPQGLLVTADLICDLDDERDSHLVELWGRLLAFSQDQSPERARECLEPLGNAVFPLPGAEYRSLLESARFLAPTRCFQAGLIQMWYTRRG